MDTSKRVLRYYDIAERAAFVWELPDIFVPVCLSLIHIESRGIPSSISPSGQHMGILQQYNPVLAPYGLTARELLHEEDGPPKSVRAFARWCMVFEHYHQWEPDWIALGHKAGAGTLKRATRINAKQGEAAYLRHLSTGKLGRWHVPTYLRRAAASFEAYSDHLLTQAD